MGSFRGGDGPRDHENTGLADVVAHGATPCGGALATGVPNVDHSPTVTLAQPWQGCPCSEKSGRCRAIQPREPFLFGKLTVVFPDIHARIIDKDVKSPSPRRHLIDESLCLIIESQVGSKGASSTSAGCDTFGNLLPGASPGSVVNGDRITCLGQTMAEIPPQATTSASDQCRWLRGIHFAESKVLCRKDAIRFPGKSGLLMLLLSIMIPQDAWIEISIFIEIYFIYRVA